MRMKLLPPFASGGASQARNPQRGFDLFGFTSNGRQVTNNNGSNALSGTQNLGTTTAALSAIDLTIMSPSSTASRYLVTVYVDGVAVISGLPVRLASGTGRTVRIPLQVASGKVVAVAVRTSTNGASVFFAAKGVKANSLDAPGFAACENLDTIDTGGTAPSTIAIQDGGAWVALKTATAREYGHLILGLAATAAPVNGQRSAVFLSDGAAGSEDASIFWEDQMPVLASTPYTSLGLFPDIPYKLANGARLSCKIVGPASNPDTFYGNAWGFY